MCAKKLDSPWSPSYGMAAPLVLYHTESRHPSAALGPLTLKYDKNPKPPKTLQALEGEKLILGIDEDFKKLVYIKLKRQLSGFEPWILWQRT